MKNKICLFILLCSYSIHAQYTVDGFYEDYVEITNYKSIAIETLGNFYWEKHFELPFTFPYYDTVVSSLHIDHEGLGKIENELDFSIRLMTFGYTFDNVLDTVDLQSDVRYKFGEKDGLQYLVLQYTKNRLFSDESVEEYDSHVNFQYWFYEDGMIEVRFGPSVLDESPVYVPGEGFYLITENEGPIPAGPQLALYHPLDEEQRLHYGDINNHEEYVFNEDISNTVDWWPSEDWVIQFKNQLVATDNIASKSSLNIFPNPAKNTLHISSKEEIKSIQIYDMMGNKKSSTNNAKTIDVSNLTKGIYQLIIDTESKIINRKFLKI